MKHLLGSTFPELFESTAAVSPRAPAVTYHDTTISYAQLNDRANRMARRLIAQGVGPDSLVAVAVPRSIDLVVVILAVLKAGGAYLPLDPTYPETRLSSMLADAQPLLLLRTARTRLSGADIPEIVIDAPGFRAACESEHGHDIIQSERLGELRPCHLMYVIYTSGSTGRPKGVAVTHDGVPDLVATQSSWLNAGPGDRVLQWASISFDAAFWDLTLGLLSGATLVMADADDLLPGQPLKEVLVQHDITHAVLPPVVLSITDSDNALKGGTIMSTGDACTRALVREWSRGRRMFNGYGPTEVTVGSTIAGPISDADEISIGVPWTGARVYLLDERLQQVPDRQEGELYLAGTGLARGYLNRPGLTATRFVPDPFGPPGSRMYRSGDRGWRRADGELFFTGRADDQVKVRGFRIELGEIEACLANHPAVDIAVVAVEGQLADALVVAYVKARSGSPVTGAELRRHVAQSLPEHMIPATVTLLEQFPASPNGKIDRKALHTSAHPVAPRPTPEPTEGDTTPEKVLYRVVTEVLGLPHVNPEDNLFELGGNSVTVAKLTTRIRKELGVNLPMRSVFQTRTLSELAQALQALK
ncbi:amino acid adenylation domain-containing protein [Streptomyces natalensis]|uniref:Peptide synthetase n=1 Tax=Streptomyces natalensis ATCC 27448 TaxID=1240678 RepID=A0A0D7CK89_9ACTN|nr:amino acid adenylation domain-containing protein [Streptomyces natalensis]KIZ16618.1 peptide synthetase [Streptomyces natalensis ATCC 27448]